MFSKVKTILLLSMIMIGASAHAEKMLNLSVGKYALTAGNSDLCPGFKIKDKDLTAKNIYLGQGLLFMTANSQTSEKSSTNALCEFKIQNVRTDTGTETVLKKITQEICQGKIHQETSITATIRSKEISVRFENPGAAPETCVFKTK